MILRSTLALAGLMSIACAIIAPAFGFPETIAGLLLGVGVIMVIAA